jgi:hypothetical protein
VRFEYESIMELAIALAFRVYGTLPDEISATLRNHRERLYPIYRRAVFEHRSNLGFPIRVGVATALESEDVYLELRLGFEAGRLIATGMPRAMSAKGAIECFVSGSAIDRSWLPPELNATCIADYRESIPSALSQQVRQVIELALPDPLQRRLSSGSAPWARTGRSQGRRFK